MADRNHVDRIQVRLPADLGSGLRVLAKLDSQTVSEKTRRVIREALENRGVLPREVADAG